MSILITGATGLIGSALKDELLKEEQDIICISRQNENLDNRVRWIQADLNDARLVNLDLPEVQFVYHLASQTSTYFARTNPLEDLQVNVVGFLNLLLLLRKQKNPPVVIMAGTTTEVGITNRNPISEVFRDDPETFYDISKLTAEMYLKQFIREGWVRGSSLRLANVYGGTNIGQRKDRGVIDKVFQKALNGEQISIYGKGEYLRDYIHILDVVSAFIQASKKNDLVNGKHFLIASGKSYTLMEAFQIAVNVASETTGNKMKIHSIDIPSNVSSIDLRSVEYDTTAFRDSTGWLPKFDLESGLRFSYKDSQK